MGTSLKLHRQFMLIKLYNEPNWELGHFGLRHVNSISFLIQNHLTLNSWGRRYFSSCCSSFGFIINTISLKKNAFFQPNFNCFLLPWNVLFWTKHSNKTKKRESTTQFLIKLPLKLADSNATAFLKWLVTVQK